MELVTTIIKMVGQVLVDTFTSPFFLALWAMIFLLVYWQNKRKEKLSASFFQGRPDFSLPAAMYSTLLGLLGGMVGSVLLIFLGIDLGSIGISALWITALLLMLIQPRFICFAYAAGIVALADLCWGFPRVSIPQLMGLVAVLHMIESLLILLNGTFRPPAVYIKRNEQLCGGFNLQYFWPIPLLALINLGLPEAAAVGLEMPSWWPLLHNYSGFAEQQTFAIVPVMAVLGYGEICTARTPRQASRRSALLLFLFSGMLLSLALLSARWPLFAWLAAFFSPLGHELVIWLGMRAESKAPIYMPTERGLKIMEVISGSSAQGSGIKSGDIIMRANGHEINHYADLHDLLAAEKTTLHLQIKRSDEELELRWPPSRRRKWELVPVPEADTANYLVWHEDRYFNLLRKVWRGIKVRLG